MLFVQEWHPSRRQRARKAIDSTRAAMQDETLQCGEEDRVQWRGFAQAEMELTPDRDDVMYMLNFCYTSLYCRCMLDHEPWISPLDKVGSDCLLKKQPSKKPSVSFRGHSTSTTPSSDLSHSTVHIISSWLSGCFCSRPSVFLFLLRYCVTRSYYTQIVGLNIAQLKCFSHKAPAQHDDELDYVVINDALKSEGRVIPQR